MVPDVLHILTTTLQDRDGYNLFLIEEETEAHRGELSCPRSYNEKTSDLAFEPWLTDSRAHYTTTHGANVGQNPACLTPQPGGPYHTTLPWRLQFPWATKSASDFAFLEELVCFGDFPTPLLLLCNILLSLLRASWEPEKFSFRAIGKLRFIQHILWVMKLMHSISNSSGAETEKDITYPSLSVCWILEPPKLYFQFCLIVELFIFFSRNCLRNWTHGRVWDSQKFQVIKNKVWKASWEK